MSMTPDAVFSALANDTRRRCLMLLHRHGELCVCELTHALGLSQPHVSRHLAQLRELGLVTDRRVGVWALYRISTTLPGWVGQVLVATLTGIGQEPPFADDDRALMSMPNRPTAACAA